MLRAMDSVRNLRRGAAVMAAAALIAVPGYWAGLAIVIAGALVPGWCAGVGLLGGMVALRILARVVSHHRGPVADASPPELGAPQTAAVWIAGMCTLLALAGQVLFSTTLTTLRPTAPGGCVLIAEESSFLMAGSGSVWFTSSPWGIARRVMSYTADDGGRPFTTGTYDLTWTGGASRLTIRDDINPVRFDGTSGDTSC